eukprot:jgi/Botrbrau1/718/Bobra.160_2s0041.1
MMQSRARTSDVRPAAESFAELLLPGWLLKGLNDAGFLQPSPVQEAAIPQARCGADLVVQAKSGTGKTAVFGVVAAERVDVDNPNPQALVIAPTREIAMQAGEIMSAIGAYRPSSGVSVGVFIGGMPTEEDCRRLRRTCHIAVGTPGRLAALLKMGALQKLQHMKLVVLDEADRLMVPPFRDDVKRLLDSAPSSKQLMAFSATYTPGLLAEVESLMASPQRVLLDLDTPSLLGVRQFYVTVQDAGEGVWAAKVQQLLRLLESVSFSQAVVFCQPENLDSPLVDTLIERGFPSAFISGANSQVERLDIINALRAFRLRVVVSNDLLARGLDLERVNLVVNLDLPQDAATYLHRVGRTGRFGTLGLAITLVTPSDLPALHAVLAGCGPCQVEPLPEVIPEDWYSYPLPPGPQAIEGSGSPTQGPSPFFKGSETLETPHSASSRAAGTSGSSQSSATVPPLVLLYSRNREAGEDGSTDCESPTWGRVIASDGEDLGPHIDWTRGLLGYQEGTQDPLGKPRYPGIPMGTGKAPPPDRRGHSSADKDTDCLWELPAAVPSVPPPQLPPARCAVPPWRGPGGHQAPSGTASGSPADGETIESEGDHEMEGSFAGYYYDDGLKSGISIALKVESLSQGSASGSYRRRPREPRSTFEDGSSTSKDGSPGTTARGAPAPGPEGTGGTTSAGRGGKKARQRKKKNAVPRPRGLTAAELEDLELERNLIAIHHAADQESSSGDEIEDTGYPRGNHTSGEAGMGERGPAGGSSGSERGGQSHPGHDWAPSWSHWHGVPPTVPPPWGITPYMQTQGASHWGFVSDPFRRVSPQGLWGPAPGGPAADVEGPLPGDWGSRGGLQAWSEPQNAQDNAGACPWARPVPREDLKGGGRQDYGRSKGDASSSEDATWLDSRQLRSTKSKGLGGYSFPRGSDAQYPRAPVLSANHGPPNGDAQGRAPQGSDENDARERATQGSQEQPPRETGGPSSGGRGPPKASEEREIREEYVRVPISLVRRYYELEYEAWVRRYREWQEAWAGYAHYWQGQHHWTGQNPPDAPVPGPS